MIFIKAIQLTQKVWRGDLTFSFLEQAICDCILRISVSHDGPAKSKERVLVILVGFEKSTDTGYSSYWIVVSSLQIAKWLSLDHASVFHILCKYVSNYSLKIIYKAIIY